MAVVAARTDVETSATLLVDGADTNGAQAVLKNITGTASVFLGGSGVTAANGFEWAVDDGPLGIDLGRGDKLYGIVAATNQTVHVLAANE